MLNLKVYELSGPVEPTDLRLRAAQQSAGSDGRWSSSLLSERLSGRAPALELRSLIY